LTPFFNNNQWLFCFDFQSFDLIEDPVTSHVAKLLSTFMTGSIGAVFAGSRVELYSSSLLFSGSASDFFVLILCFSAICGWEGGRG